MNVRVVNLNTTKRSKPNTKRGTHQNKESCFYSSLSVQTRHSNGSLSKNGYNINFFDKGKAKRYYNINAKINTSDILKRNRTPIRSGTINNPSAIPLSIRITNVFDNRKKSKSKQSFLSPIKTRANVQKKRSEKGHQIQRIEVANDEDSLIESKKQSKLKVNSQMKHIMNTTADKNKRPVINKREDEKRDVSSVNAKGKIKKLSLFDNNNEHTLLANEIPDNIRKKMLVYYQANTINYRIDKPKGDKMSHRPPTNAPNNNYNHHQRCNLLSNMEQNKEKVKANLGLNFNDYSNCSNAQRDIAYNNDINPSNGKTMSNSIPITSNHHRATSKNRYRDLINQYLFEEENSKYEKYI